MPVQKGTNAETLHQTSVASLIQYQARGRLADLNRAVTCCQKALTLVPRGSPERPAYLNTLGLGLRALYTRTRAFSNLEAAISAFQQAVQDAPPDASDRPVYLSHLGEALLDRYARTGALDDLEAAESAFQQAAREVPPAAPDHPPL